MRLCPDQRYRAATFVSSSEVQHASVAGQSGHAKNCLAILLNAALHGHPSRPLAQWPWKDCDIEALQHVWHEPRFQRVAFWHRAALAIMLAQPSSAPIECVFSALLKTVHVRSRRQPRPRPVWFSVSIDDDLLQLASACPSMMCLCISVCLC